MAQKNVVRERERERRGEGCASATRQQQRDDTFPRCGNLTRSGRCCERFDDSSFLDAVGVCGAAGEAGDPLSSLVNLLGGENTAKHSESIRITGTFAGIVLIAKETQSLPQSLHMFNTYEGKPKSLPRRVSVQTIVVVFASFSENSKKVMPRLQRDAHTQIRSQQTETGANL